MADTIASPGPVTPPGSPSRTVKFADGTLAEKNGEAIPLASSYPVINHLTPRARRRENLKAEGERKKKENEERAKAAAAKRARNANTENNPAESNVPHSTGTSNAKKVKPNVGPIRRARDGTLRGTKSGEIGPEDHTECEKKLNEALAKMEEAQASIESLESENDELESANMELETSIEKARSDTASLSKQLADEQSSFQKSLAALQQQLEAKESEMRTLSESLKSSKSSLVEATRQHETEKGRLESSLAELQADHSRTVASLEASEKNTVALRLQIAEQEEVKKQLRNTILELKGNIRVFARVRPQLKDDQADQQGCFRFPSDDPEHRSLTLTGDAVESFDGSKGAAKTWDFQFDRVFRSYEGQEAVFSEVSQVVQSVLDGYRVCIFAYGQTGSGKTYTMEGDGTNGIIPRSVDFIFRSLGSKEGWAHELKASFLEIYNEQLRDLAAGGKELGEIRHGVKTSETTVVGLSEVVVSSPEQTVAIMREANAARAVAATQSNDRSSRSHSVFTLTVTSTHTATGQQTRGVLNLVDLAGSERLAESKASGQQLKETQAINKSLSSLGDVIFALASGSKHVPFRNSKLTYLLQNSLGGNCKTLMMLNLSPSSCNESLCSLRFGHKVNSCDIGTAKVVKVQK